MFKWPELPPALFDLCRNAIRDAKIPHLECEQKRGVVHITRRENLDLLIDPDIRDALTVVYDLAGPEAAQDFILARKADAKAST